MSRLKSSSSNFAYGLGAQFIQILSQFVVRTYFATYLGIEYVGLYAFLVSAIGMFALAELGAATAFSYLLYSPLASGDEKEISKLVNWYSRFYRKVSASVFLMGAASAPVLLGSVDSDLSSQMIYGGFTIFLLDMAGGYLLAHYRTLVTADQRERVVSSATVVNTVLKTLIQVIVIVTTENFLLFLLVQLIGTISLNVYIARRVRADYPYLSLNKSEYPTPQERKAHWVKLRAMFLHRVGSTVASSSENIVLGVTHGLEVVGGLANYRLMLAAVDKTLAALHSAIAASVGNLTAGTTIDHSVGVFRVLYYLNAWISILVVTVFITFSDAAIVIWLGNDFVIQRSMVIWLGINFFLRALRRPVNTFKTSYGLFVRDRFRPLIEAFVSILVSLIGVNLLGPVGVLIGPFVAYIGVTAWIEPAILYRHGFHRPVGPYFLLLVATCLVSISTTSLSMFIVRSLEIKFDGWQSLALSLFVPTFLGLAVPLVLIRNTREFKEIKRIAASIIRRDK